MQCPNDNTTLQMTTREGIEIDYCPQCRGVWLDRGELDKIIDRSVVPAQQDHSQQPRQHDQPREGYREERRDDDDYRGDHNNHQKHHKKEGFLGDLFDF
ncbi:MAG TPA: zf-TFIIB domain-containing protein [Candidatus Saccharimonadales bacterium]|jgi:uncharacterized protein|nr:zf-TFIIB domain-containing protein [Candidatus Saccharimonadales bacterium]